MLKRHRKTLGWLSLVTLVVWLYYDYQQKFREAIISGYVSILLALAHIFA